MAASSSSSILSALSSSGLGTGQGIDVTSTVNTLIANLRGPEQVWQTQQKTLQNQAASLTQLRSEVTALSNAVENLSDPAVHTRLVSEMTRNLERRGGAGSLLSSCLSFHVGGNHQG